MSMDVEMEAPAEAESAPEVDEGELALYVAALVNALPECVSFAVEGLDGDAPKIVCKPAEGDPVEYPLDAAALEEAIAAVAEVEDAEVEE